VRCDKTVAFCTTRPETRPFLALVCRGSARNDFDSHFDFNLRPAAAIASEFCQARQQAQEMPRHAAAILVDKNISFGSTTIST